MQEFNRLLKEGKSPTRCFFSLKHKQNPQQRDLKFELSDIPKELNKMAEQSQKDKAVCIVTGKEMELMRNEAEDKKAEVYTVSGGVVCTASGNYGSAIYDPLDNEVLQFFISDEGLKELANKGLLKRFALTQTTDTTAEELPIDFQNA